MSSRHMGPCGPSSPETTHDALALTLTLTHALPHALTQLLLPRMPRKHKCGRSTFLRRRVLAGGPAGDGGQADEWEEPKEEKRSCLLAELACEESARGREGGRGEGRGLGWDMYQLSSAPSFVGGRDLAMHEANVGLRGTQCSPG